MTFKAWVSTLIDKVTHGISFERNYHVRHAKRLTAASRISLISHPDATKPRFRALPYPTSGSFMTTSTRQSISTKPLLIFNEKQFARMLILPICTGKNAQQASVEQGRQTKNNNRRFHFMETRLIAMISILLLNKTKK